MISMNQIFVLMFESFVILPYVRPTFQAKVFGDAPEWFRVVLWLSPPWISCSGGNSSISIFGSGSKWLFVVFTTFFGRGV